MLHFDERGYLTPYKAIPSTVKEMKEYFVDNIKSDIRKGIFERYIRYSDELKDALGGIPLKQWVNGSFVTKKANPKDIDLVTFIDVQLLKKHGVKLNAFRKGVSWEIYGVDGYIEEVLPTESKYHKITQYNAVEWLDLFSRNREDGYGIRVKKGFLEINY